MKKVIIAILIAVMSILKISSISANSNQTSAATVGFVISPKDRTIKVIKINGQTYLRNYENHTLIITKHAKNGNVSEFVRQNDDYNSVKINFDKTATYHITVLNGPSDVQN